MPNRRRLYRSRDALIGGVCAGIASYFEADPLVVRILAIVLALITVGIAIIVYLILWLAVPKEPLKFTPFDVQPRAAKSDRFGSVSCSVESDQFSHAADVATPAAMAGWRYTQPTYSNSAHRPPEPPAHAPVPGGVATSAGSAGTASAGAVSARPSVPSSAASTSPAGGAHARRQAREPYKATSRARVQLALVIGSLLLFFIIAFIASVAIDQVEWWQFWPLFMVILGIVRMVLPDPQGWALDGFSWGFALFVLGVLLLPMSLGLFAWSTLVVMISQLGSILCLAGVVFVIGVIVGSSALRFIAAVLFAAFCLLGFAFCSVPGTLDALLFTAPYGREYSLTFFAHTLTTLS